VTALLHTGLPALETSLVRITGLVIGAGLVSVAAGAVYRWYARARIPEGLAVLLGASLVAIYFNSQGALSAVIGGDTALLSLEEATLNVVTFGAATLAAIAGCGVGDRIGETVAEATDEHALGTDVTAIVRSAGRVTAVTLPEAEDIGDLESYEPVPAGTKETLGGETLVFPRRLTAAELRERLIERLRVDYGVGHVDVEFDDEGGIEYLAIGSRESGIGPTLPPESAAVAIRADPALAASAGDVVQVYEPRPEGPERVTTAEVRDVADDVVTVAVDAADASALDDTTRYRLVTLPVQPRPDREFASLLRAAEETMGVATVGEDSDLVGVPIGALDVAVAAVRSVDGPIEAIPPRARSLVAGDTVYAVDRPARLRRLELAATGAGASPLAVDAVADDD
jgi:hypothetical protein